METRSKICYLAAQCIVTMFEIGSIGSKVLEGYRLFMNFKLLLVKYYLVQFDMPGLEFMVILIVI